ncbi:MAG: riboflavin synthase [Pseudomonadales bacterium]|nr:riboflavin synthase [Pseudomonadales bacterium]
MFTGIIEAIGSIESLVETDSDWRLTISTGKLDLGDVKLGDSIAVSGCCLTVVELAEQGFAADVSGETLRCTTLGELKPGMKVNLEKAMLATDRFGGHIVSGHVDGVGALLSMTPEGGSQRLEFEMPKELSRYVAAKGSICIDGTSLTVNQVVGNTFTINVIPHTQQETVIGMYAAGQKVNLEVDVVARYLERLNADDQDAAISEQFLEEHGFKSSQQA